MGWPVTINGNTYNASDFEPYGYVTNFPAILSDLATVAAAIASAADGIVVGALDVSGDGATATVYDTTSYVSGVGGTYFFDFKNASGTQRHGASIRTDATTGTNGAEVADLIISTMRAGTLTDAWRVSGAGALTPATDDGAALGDATHLISDLYLASGAVIYWTNDGTLTHSSNLLTLAGVDLEIAGNLTVGGDAVITRASLETAPDIRRNRIVNPCMQISQENGNTAGTTNLYYPADQWLVGYTCDGAISVARVASATPEGAVYRLRYTVVTADASIGAAQALTCVQVLEGSKVADFLFGTSAAKSGIIRFGIKAPAGTYGVSIRNAASDRSFVAEITISSGEANTDVVKEVPFTGDITGTWQTGDVSSWLFGIILAAGSDRQGSTGWQAGNKTTTANQSNGMSSNTNVFEIFDVGLKMDVDGIGQYGAFEVPDPAQELRACQRYYEKVTSGSGQMFSTTVAIIICPLLAAKRTASVTATILTAGNVYTGSSPSPPASLSFPAAAGSSFSANFNLTGAIGSAGGGAIWVDGGIISVSAKM